MSAAPLPPSDRPSTRSVEARAEAEPRLTDRLFFALYPDADAVSRLVELAQGLKRSHGLQGRVFEPQRFHVTLQFLGDHAGVSDALLVCARQAADALPPSAMGHDAKAIELRFDRVTSFAGTAGRHPLVLLGREEELAPLQALHDRLRQALLEAGWAGPLPSRFTPHVTLMYDAQGLAEQAVEPVHWQAREFVLVHSRVGQSVHRPLARWALH